MELADVDNRLKNNAAVKLNKYNLNMRTILKAEKAWMEVQGIPDFTIDTDFDRANSTRNQFVDFLKKREQMQDAGEEVAEKAGVAKNVLKAMENIFFCNET